jgi:hypothetical protein
MCLMTAMGFAKGSTHPTIGCLTGDLMAQPRRDVIAVFANRAADGKAACDSS